MFDSKGEETVHAQTRGGNSLRGWMLFIGLLVGASVLLAVGIGYAHAASPATDLTVHIDGPNKVLNGKTATYRMVITNFTAQPAALSSSLSVLDGNTVKALKMTTGIAGGKTSGTSYIWNSTLAARTRIVYTFSAKVSTTTGRYCPMAMVTFNGINHASQKCTQAR